MRTIIVTTLIMGLSFLIGCKPTSQSKSENKKSTLNTFIEGATGKTAVDAGKRAEEKLLRVSEQRNNDLNEVLGE